MWNCQQIWKECDQGENGYLDRDSTYKSMALCALGQQGKGVELKTLINMGDVGEPTRHFLIDTENKHEMTVEGCGPMDVLIWLC